MDVVLGLDLGTTYFKCMVASRNGTPLSIRRVPVESERPQPGYAVLSCERFSHLIQTVVTEALAQAGCEPGDVVSVSYASQANSLALFDRQMSPLTPLILWTDERTSDGSVYGLDTYSILCERQIDKRALPAKLLWLQFNMPSTWARTAYVLTISDFLVYLISGEIAGDAATTSLTGITDLVTSSHIEEMCTALRLKTTMRPRIVTPGRLIGNARGKLADQLGLGPDSFVVAGNLDHVAASIGAGIGVQAPASVSLGTVLAVMGVTDEAPSERVVHDELSVSGPYPRPGSYFNLTFRDMGGSTLEWYRTTFAAKKTFKQLSDEAAATPPGCNGVVMLPHVAHTLGTSRSVFVQPLHSATVLADGVCVRAIMEATAAMLGELIGVVFGDPRPNTAVVTGGGARSRLWLQIIADMTGMDIARSTVDEPAAYGAAVHAAAGALWYSDIEDVTRNWLQDVEHVRPDTERHHMYRKWKETNYERVIRRS